MLRIGLFAAALIVTPSVARAQVGPVCPTEDEVRQAIERYITVDYWSPGERQIWRITAVDGFSFAAVTFGRPGQRAVDFGPPQTVCPVRVVYGFTVTHADGRVEQTEMGEGKTELFYRDGFGDWTFKIE